MYYKYDTLIPCFSQSKNYLDCNLGHNQDCNLDCDPEDVPVYMGDSLFNTKRIVLLFIVRSLLHYNPPYIWIQMGIHIECLHWTKFLDPEGNPDNFSLCKQCTGGISYYIL